MSIEQIFTNRGTGPYAKPLKVKVVIRGEIVSYRDGRNNERQSLNVAIADSERCLRCVVYDPLKFSKFREGNSLVLRDVIRKTDDNTQAIVVTKNTKVFITTAIDVPDYLVEAGRKIIYPPPADVIPIAEAVRSPPRARVSITGKIIQEETKTLSVRGENVNLKSIHLEDGTSKVRVALWREASTVECRPGDHVTITDVTTNIYQGETSLQTTVRSEIKKTDTPTVVSRVLVVGVSVDDSGTELLIDDDKIITVPSELLAAAVSSDGPVDIEMVTADGPLALVITCKGSEVLNIDLDE